MGVVRTKPEMPTVNRFSMSDDGACPDDGTKIIVVSGQIALSELHYVFDHVVVRVEDEVTRHLSVGEALLPVVETVPVEPEPEAFSTTGKKFDRN